MSVIYRGKEYKVKKKKGLLTLKISRKKIKYISDLKGLESLTELQVLKLNDNSIIDIEGLELLKNLLILDLSYNKITNIKGISQLTQLKELNLAFNSILEIDGVETLINLEELHLEHNKISGIKGLNNLSKLQKLDLMFNDISQVESFENKENLTDFSLLMNPISHYLRFISGNSNLERIQTFARMSNQELEQTVVEGMAQNGLVSYNGREIKVIMKKNRSILDLSGKGIRSISEIKGLENLTTLQVLDLSNNPIEELEGLDNLKNLVSLNLFKCKIKQIKSFNNKQFLEYLILGRNPIYRSFKTAVSKRKKLARMAEEERSLKGVNPTLWKIGKNFQGKLLNEPKSGGAGADLAAGAGEVALGAGQICCECLTVVIVLVGFVPLLRLLF